MPISYSYCRNANPDDSGLPWQVKDLDRQMTAIGFKIDLGSHKDGKYLEDAVDCFVDCYGGS